MIVERHDVVIVGASIAGCTAAILFARAGLSVVLLDAAADPGHYKKLCTHYLQSSALETLQKIGVLEALLERGAIANKLRIHTRWGWIDSVTNGSERHGYNIKRSIIDPVLRQMAAAQPGVTMALDTKVRALRYDGGRVVGVEAEDGKGAVRSFEGRLIVGADGRKSTLSRLAQLPEESLPNHRFGYFAHFRGLQSPDGASLSWLLDPVCVNQFPNGDVTVLSCLLPKSHMAAFREDVDGNFRALFRGLPDGPNLDRAERVSSYFGVYDFPNTYRPQAPDGLVLVGDAAMASDPLAGVGCGWALQSSEWLCDTTTSALTTGADVDVAVRKFRALHRERLYWHRFTIAQFSRAHKFSLVERFFLRAAARDREVAALLHRFLARDASAGVLLAPKTLLRALRSHLVPTVAKLGGELA